MSQENSRLDCQPYSSGQMVKRLTDLSANLYLQVISTFSVSTEICSAMVQQENKLSVTEILHGTLLLLWLSQGDIGLPGPPGSPLLVGPPGAQLFKGQKVLIFHHIYQCSTWPVQSCDVIFARMA